MKSTQANSRQRSVDNRKIKPKTDRTTHTKDNEKASRDNQKKRHWLFFSKKTTDSKIPNKPLPQQARERLTKNQEKQPKKQPTNFELP